MFTGIIQAIGKIAAMEPTGSDMRLHVQGGDLPMSNVALGDSIATNGVCLTVIDLPGDGYWADVSGESLEHTTMGDLRPGAAVNLEKALTPTTHLGGHIVSGHVDGVGKVIERSHDGRSVRFRIQAPDELAKYIAKKGSITVDGASLTVNHIDGAVFELNIVPHTLQETIMASYKVGTAVNLEVDVLARYLERLLLGERAAKPETPGVTAGFLAEHGFMR